MQLENDTIYNVYAAEAGKPNDAEETMLNNREFDLWAEEYDRSVALSNADGSYPFAGYRDVLNRIYGEVLRSSQKTVLDIGFGTGTLTSKLYENGCTIFGQDFSQRMIELSQSRMPRARLYCGDFAEGLAAELLQNSYDAVIATYALHHLTDAQKVEFIRCLLPLLNDNGCIYIGDVAFSTRRELEACKEKAGAEWDDDEIYFVFDELRQSFPKLEFEQMSHCAGVLFLRK